MSNPALKLFLVLPGAPVSELSNFGSSVLSSGPAEQNAWNNSYIVHGPMHFSN